MNATICDAIEKKKILEFRYSGYSRIVEPYAHGSDKKGNDILRGFQIAGGSKKGTANEWKIFKVGEITSLQVTDKTFVPRQDYRRGDSAMASICCQL